jgi:hypothetical protein
MDAAPCSCGSAHGSNGCTHTQSQGQRQQQGPQYPSQTVLQLTGPSASTAPAFTTSYIHFPTSQSGTDVFNASHNHYNLQRCYELPDHSVSSHPTSHHLSDSNLHLPQSVQSHIPSLNQQTSRDSQATSNAGKKRRQPSSNQDTSSRKHTRKHPRVPAVPTVDPPSMICGVGPLTLMDSHLSPTTPARSSTMPSCSVSASLQPPVLKRRDKGQSTAATDVWYFCCPEASATMPSERPPPNQEQPLTRRPKALYISCKLCS